MINILLKEGSGTEPGTVQLVLKASRLARLMRDDHSQEWLQWELQGYPSNDQARPWLTRTGRWADEEQKKAFFVPLTRLATLAESLDHKIRAMQGMSFGGEWASVAAREHQQALSSTAKELAQLRAIEGNVVSAIYDFVGRTYHELLFSDLQLELFTSAQAEIDSRLATLAGDALSKVDSLRDRLRAGDAESISQAMSTCRRLIDAAANALFPPREQPFNLGGQQLAVKQPNTLNRLQAYVYEHGVSKGRRDRLRRTFADLYDRTSTGTHSEVDVIEARYLFLQTYVALGELLALDGLVSPEVSDDGATNADGQ
jgi:hypothetical protein